ncbi:hypothetical protein JCM10213v2_007197 [Rhodosporidiobolus nylandii]
MSTRAKHARKATERTIYVEETGGSSDDDSEDDEVGRARGGKGKGKGREREDDSDSDEWNGAPAKKHKKGTGKQKGKGKRTQKKDVGDLLEKMPMDLVVEILSYLLPSELLVLSRVSKTYRALLTTKRSQSVWRTSRGLVGLPDLEADDWSEMAYAAMVFGTRCQACDRQSSGRPDTHLRIRLCRDCRKDYFVKLKSLRKSPEYHPLLDHVLASTPYSPTDGRWPDEHTRYALRADIEYYNRVLNELQEEDDAAADLAGLKAATTTRSGRSSRRSSAVVPPQLAELTRVQRFVEERRPLLQVDGKTLHSVYDEARKAADQLQCKQYRLNRKLSEAKADVKGYPSKIRRDRRAAITKRLHAEGALPQYRSLWGPLWDACKVVNRAVPLTDDEWDKIKPEVLATVSEYVKVPAYDRTEGIKWRTWQDFRGIRTAAIRVRYDALFDEKASSKFQQATFPLFRDFLCFESTRQMLLGDDFEADFAAEAAKLSDEEWDAALPFIMEEIEQYRLDVFLHAVKLVLSATTDDPLPNDDEILDNAGEYDDTFFARATSLVCCTYGQCELRFSHDWPAGRFSSAYPTFIGSLVDVLRHQHAQHDAFHSPSRKLAARGPQINLSLPLEVACATSALLELGGLNDKTATIKQLGRVQSTYTWENSHLHKKHYRDWHGLLDAVYLESERYSRMRPPRNLDPPCIISHRRR